MQTKKLIQVGIVTSIFVAAVVSFYASSNPDGLEYVAEQVGFLNTAKDSAVAGFCCNCWSFRCWIDCSY